VRRYMEGLPVLAHRGSALYHLRSFVRRHRLILALACIFTLVITTGTFTTWRYARQSRKHLERAVQVARQVLNKIDVLSAYPNEQTSVLPLAQEARAALADLATENQGNEEILGLLLSATIQLGELQGDPSVQNRGDTAGAIATLRSAVLLGERLQRKN